MDYSEQRAIEFIEKNLDGINDLSIGNWYEIELEDIQNCILILKMIFKIKKLMH